MPRWLQQALLWLGLLSAMRLSIGIAVFLLFPHGGGVFHAMFAYSDDGRSEVALAYAITMGVATLGVGSLAAWLRVPLKTLSVAGAAALATWWCWQDVQSWPHPVSVAFRDLATTMGWLLPLASALATGLNGYLLNRSHKTRR